MQYSHADILTKTIKISQIQIQIINKLTNAKKDKKVHYVSKRAESGTK